MCIVPTSRYEVCVSYLRPGKKCVHRTYVLLRTACIEPTTSRYEVRVSYLRPVTNCVTKFPYRTYVSLRTVLRSACIVSYPRPVAKCGHAPVTRCCCSASRRRYHATTPAPPSPCSPPSHRRRIFLLARAIRIMKTTIRRPPATAPHSRQLLQHRPGSCVYV